jgi:hypothetical protein
VHVEVGALPSRISSALRAEPTERVADAFAVDELRAAHGSKHPNRQDHQIEERMWDE